MPIRSYRVLVFALSLVCAVAGGCAEDRLDVGSASTLEARRAALIAEDADTSALIAPAPVVAAVNGGVDIAALADALGVTLQPALVLPLAAESLAAVEETAPPQSETCATTETLTPAQDARADERRGPPAHVTERPRYDIHRERETPPRGVYGGEVRPFPRVAGEVIALGAAYRAAGCGDDARYGDPACARPPYRLVIDAEVSP